MEKIVYPVWKAESVGGNEFRDRLLGSVADALLQQGIAHLRICVVDDDVAPAAQYRMESSKPPMDAVIFMWVNSATFRASLEQVIGQAVARFCGYLVTESEPIVNRQYVSALGERTHGMNEIVFLSRPPRLAYRQWLDIWLNSHTQIAIDTQSTFGYRQNVVVRPLTYAPPPFDAIIEENFPAAAMHGRQAFYAAEGDEPLYKEREKMMIESCMRFIDFDKIDCIPMSEYVLR